MSEAVVMPKMVAKKADMGYLEDRAKGFLSEEPFMVRKYAPETGPVGTVLICEKENDGPFIVDCVKPDWNEYGETWRLWTNLPSNELRNNTSW